MFHPNMYSTTEGFAVTGELKYRSWNGVLADVWDVEGRSGAVGEYVSEHPRLFVVLEESKAGSISIDAAPRPSANLGHSRLSFIPAGMRTWSHLSNPTRLRHLDLHFDISTLGKRFAGELDSQRAAEPRLMFENERLLALANLLAADCITPALHDLYGDSLALALFIELFQVPRLTVARPGQLSARRLRHAIDFIEANCLRNIKLQELADLVGLSQSYFSSAFKASTGMAPHQWHARARIERVKTLLLRADVQLTEVAAVAGFADQAHMSRAFKQHAGLSPAAWVRANRPLV